MRDTFASERLAMRPLAADDAEALHEGYGDVELMRWWSTPPHASIAETRDYLVGDDDDEAGDEWHGWAVTLDGEPIGTVSAGPRRPGVWEIGYLLLRRYWGHGYGREMVGRLIALLIEEESARRIYADVDPDNAASVALLEGLGFRLEGRLRAAWESHIGIRDALIFGLLREEWGSARSDPGAARARALAMLVRPIGLMGVALAMFGLTLAIMPRVPGPVAGVVLVLALVQILVAAVLRRRAVSSSAATRA